MQKKAWGITLQTARRNRLRQVYSLSFTTPRSHLPSAIAPATRRADEKLHDSLLAMRARVAQAPLIPGRWLEILKALTQFFTAPWLPSGLSGLFFIYTGNKRAGGCQADAQLCRTCRKDIAGPQQSSQKDCASPEAGLRPTLGRSGGLRPQD
jgi:hypothetical protein